MLDSNKKNPTKELMLFWPLVFQLLDDTKTMMLVRKNTYVGLQQQQTFEGTDVVLAT